MLERAKRDGIFGSMSLDVLLRENEVLREELAQLGEQLVERNERVADLEEQLTELAKQLELTARERALLAAKLEELHRLRRAHPFLVPGQGLLGFDESSASIPQAAPLHLGEAPDGENGEDKIRSRHKPKRPARKLDTSNLPVEHRFHELPEAERICPLTGKYLVPVGEELEEEIDFQPGSLKRIVHHKLVYGLSEEDRLERQAPGLIAPAPPRPLDQSPVGATLLAWILVQKYLHHIPLYRQEQIFERQGLRIPRQTMCDWVMAAANLLGPIQMALRRKILSSDVVQIDDTPVKCQAGRGQGNFLAYLWTLTSPLAEGVVYDFTEGRGTEHILTVLPDFKEGVLVGDGYSGNGALAKAREGLVIAGCWAHSIRKFRDALREAPLEAVEAMTLIGKLFDLEQQADQGQLAAAQRLALRRAQATAWLEALDKRLTGWRDRYPESGKMGEACKYLENQAAPLRVFLDDGRVPIHNNACEVAIRPVALGRKNWLFAGSVRGGKAAATVYTLVECCKLVRADPFRYLADVLIRVGTHPASRVEELLPARWNLIFGPAQYDRCLVPA